MGKIAARPARGTFGSEGLTNATPWGILRQCVGVVFSVVSENFRRLIVATLETNDDGGLRLPPELIGKVGPHTKFELEVLGDILLLRRADRDRPFWQQATSQQRAEAFQRWADAPRPPAPDLTDESLRRENLYD
jgi:hypothetical protein